MNISEWKKTGLLPTAGLAAWYACEPASGATSTAAPDLSGNGRHLVGTSGAGNAPAVQSNVLNGNAAWYFNGTTNQPLKIVSPVTWRHVFIVAAFDTTSFVQFRGLTTGVAAGDVLISNDSGTNFFFLSSAYQYRLNAALRGDNDWLAPLGGRLGLVELLFPAPGSLYDGIQLGQQTNQTGRRHKGHIAEMMLFETEQTPTDVERIRLYFRLKYGITSLPLQFPSDDLLPFRRTRFYADPPDYQKLTDTFEFEDGGRTFNEVAPPSLAVRKWEYDYAYRKPEEAKLFDAFYDQARLTNAFLFRDKYGVVHTGVRVESYNRRHESYKSWRNDVRFRLVKYP